MALIQLLKCERGRAGPGFIGRSVPTRTTRSTSRMNAGPDTNAIEHELAQGHFPGLRIVDATGGEVTPNDFYGVESQPEHEGEAA